MRTDLFDFDLPSGSIALEPAQPRDAARLLVVDPSLAETLSDATMRSFPALLRPGDAVVFNDTRVIPAALTGQRWRDGAPSLAGSDATNDAPETSTGKSVAQISFNLHRRLDESRWLAFAKPARRLAVGDHIVFNVSRTGSVIAPDVSPALAATVAAKGEAGEITLAFTTSGAKLDAAIARHGSMPLPPYIASKRVAGSNDATAYQTIYARHDGAVAAPTAGLHFTDDLMQELRNADISLHFTTLHVGAGTFVPVKVDDTSDHVMHSEWGEITSQTADALNKVRARGGRIVAIGTTALRLLESATTASGQIMPFAGETDIFITPGYQFRAVDLLLTNFHLPRSTLFMLVAAFTGLETMHAAYAHAIKANYRFYSYGDACLLHPARALS